MEAPCRAFGHLGSGRALPIEPLPGIFPGTSLELALLLTAAELSSAAGQAGLAGTES